MEIQLMDKEVNVSDMTEQEREHYLLHKKHAGHEKQHLEMLGILIFVMIVAQIILVWWRSKHFKSYQHVSMLGMYIIPTIVSIHRHWWRFVSIWLLMSIVTTALVWRPLLVPNFSRSGSSIPRLLYRWFYVVYSISSLVAVTGYIIIMGTFFGINVLLGLPPQFMIDFGFLLLFYGIYYGVLCRDFTDFLVDKLAARIGYYNPKSALPSRALDSSVCAICGRSHGIQIDDSVSIDSHTEPLITQYPQEISAEEAVEINEADSESNSKPEEKIFVLTCGHKFHEYCIYGWCLVGKRQVCPFCREKVDLGRLFSSLPFQKPHYLYGNLLDFIRYLLAWQPLIFFIVQAVNYTLGLE